MMISKERGLRQRKTTEEFISRARATHGNKYDYSMVEYLGAKRKVKIICPIHGAFWQLPWNHIKTTGCTKCGIHKQARINSLSFNVFLNRANQVHADKYGYELVEYTNKDTKVAIRCKKHGVFFQTPHNHCRGAGCPKCNASRGEREIRKTLKELKVDFIEQYPLSLFKIMRFDFYVPDFNLCIEYNGEQHYKPIKYFGGMNDLVARMKRDRIKYWYCQLNDIQLLSIPFWNDNISNCVVSAIAGYKPTPPKYAGHEIPKEV